MAARASKKVSLKPIEREIRKARQALEKMHRTSSARNRRVLAVKIKKLARMERTLPDFCVGKYDILGG